MSKKNLTVEERVKKYGNNIVGIGFFYLVIEIIIAFINISTLLDPINFVLYVALLSLLFGMVLGITKRKRYGISAAWLFEIYMLILLVLSFFGIASVDFIGLIVMIWLPSDIVRFSKALKELNG